MEFNSNITVNQFNTQADCFDNDDTLMDKYFRTVQDIFSEHQKFDEEHFTYHPIEDDDKIPDSIIAEFEESIKENKQYRPKASTHLNNDKITENIEHKSSVPISIIDNIPNEFTQQYNSKMQRDKWEIIDFIAKIHTGSYAALYLTHQKYNNNHYIVFTKTSSKRKPKNFALPLSIAGFTADCLYDALNDNGSINQLLPTARENWFLCKDYGTIYPHPKTRVTISQQMYGSNYYIVISKYNRHNKAKHFAFSVSYLQETADALKKAYADRKQYSKGNFTVVRSDNIPSETNKSNYYNEKMLKCICGHKPELYEIHIDFDDRPGITYFHCYCTNCRKFAKETEFDKEKAIFYWNQMIRKLKRTNKSQGRFIKIKTI